MAEAYNATLDSALAESSKQSPKRILFINHTAMLGGGEIALMNMLRHLDQSRFKPVILLFADGPLAQALRPNFEVHLILLDERIAKTKKDSLGLKRLLGFGAVLGIVRFVFLISRFIASQRVDLVHTNSLKSDIVGGLAAKIARRRLVWHVRDRISDDYLPHSVAALFRFLARRLPSHVIANSRSTMHTLRTGQWASSKVPSPAELRRMSVVHDGVVLDDTVKPASQSSVTTFGLIGRISPWKGQHIFIKAAALVHAAFPAVRFYIIGAPLFGEQEYELEIHQLVAELNLTNVVEFTGFCQNVTERIEQLDAVVHASTTGEPFGQVIIEGMAAAKPLIATDGGGVPEIVVDGETGILVPMGDAAAMATAMRWMIEHPREARDMGAHGRKRVVESFSIQRSVRNVEAVFAKVLSGG